LPILTIRFHIHSRQLILALNPCNKRTKYKCRCNPTSGFLYQSHIPSPIKLPTNLSVAWSGSCLAISMILNSFLIPICRPFIDSSSPEAKPASANMCIALLRCSSVSKSSTEWSTYSKDSRLEIGATRSSESNASESPTSVKTGRRDVVAMTRRRCPFITTCQLDSLWATIR
jgi:hypothetical protein